jgi:Cell wall-active antibiotics response 4TMS YvqF
MTSPTPPAPQVPVTAVGITPMLIPSESVPERQGMMGVLASVTREGDWVLPRLFRVLCVMGNATIDLTQVRLGAGESLVEVRCIMGEVKLIVPHNLRVECAGHPVLGEFTVKRWSDSRAMPEAPLIRIDGISMMGSVTVRVIDPNEDKWARRLRRLGLSRASRSSE